MLPQDLANWCRLAQKEQIDEETGHVFANFRHSTALNLIAASGVDGFECALSLIEPVDLSSLDPNGDLDFGLTQIEIDRATSRFHSDATCAAYEDFRLAGKFFDWPNMLISLQYRQSRVRAAPSIGATRFRPSPTMHASSVPRLIWLTRPDHVLIAVKSAAAAAHGSKLTETGFFQLVVALLGLRPRKPLSGIGDCTLVAYELLPGKSLTRPHVFSQGYPERFCGVSRFGRFGSTADNRTGHAGLPEAIALGADLRQIGVSDPRFSAFVNELSSFVDFSDVTRDTQSGRCDVTDLHAQDDMTLARRTILQRMRRAKPGMYCVSLQPHERPCYGRATSTCL